MANAPQRISETERESAETRVKVSVNIDGCGKYNFPIKGDVDLREPSVMFYFNHGLHSMILWGLQDLDGYLEVMDGSAHHGYEDASIVLGRAYKKAFGDKKGIRRAGSGILPFEGNRAEVAIDISGRGYADAELEVRDPKTEEMVHHVLISLTRESGIDLCARTYGKDDHHQLEALFKLLGRTVYDATRFLESYTEVLSTKGKLE